MKTFEEWAQEMVQRYPGVCERHPYFDSKVSPNWECYKNYLWVADGIWEVGPWQIQIEHDVREPGDRRLKGLEIYNYTKCVSVVVLLCTAASVFASWAEESQRNNWDIDGNPEEQEK